MKWRDVYVIAFGVFVAISAGYVAARIAMAIGGEVGLDEYWGGVTGVVTFAAALLFIDGTNHERRQEQSILRLVKRLKSRDKLQAEALDVLRELIARDLLRIGVSISNPAVSLECHPGDVYMSGSRSASNAEIRRELLTGMTLKKRGGPGITIDLRGQMRLGSEKEEEEVRASLQGDGEARSAGRSEH